jgi:hypothetical protein
MIRVIGILADFEKDEEELFEMSGSDFISRFKLENHRLYDIGMDQSNSCTGIGFLSLDEKTGGMLEVVNQDNMHYTDYRKALLKVLNTILEGARIRYLVMEEPLNYMSGRRNAQLNELKKVLDRFMEGHIGKGVEHCADANPGVWRKGLYTEDNPYKKRTKLATVYEVIKLYPIFKKFIEYSTSKVYRGKTYTDYDGFEALGIILGYRNRHEISNDTEITKILGPKNTTKVALAFFCYEDSNLIHLKKVINIINKYAPELDKPKVKIYNEEESIYHNVKMALVDKFVISTIPNKFDTIAMLHRFGLKIKEGCEMTMVVIPYSKLKSSMKQAVNNGEFFTEIFY